MFSKPSFMTGNAWVFGLLIYEYVYFQWAFESNSGPKFNFKIVKIKPL